MISAETQHLIGRIHTLASRVDPSPHVECTRLNEFTITLSPGVPSISVASQIMFSKLPVDFVEELEDTTQTPVQREIKVVLKPVSQVALTMQSA